MSFLFVKTFTATGAERRQEYIAEIKTNTGSNEGIGSDQRQNFHKEEVGREKGSHRAEGQGGTYFTGKGNREKITEGDVRR